MFETNNHTCDATFCTFDAVVGGVLALMCLVGFILNTLVLWILLVVKVNVPGKQTYSLSNLSITGLLLSLVGIQRGLGIVSHSLFIGGANVTHFCVTFAFLVNIVGLVNILALIPLTLERFMAILFPFHHRTFLTTRNCWIMCLLTWIPNLVFLVVEVASYKSNVPGTMEVEFSIEYHRCVFSNMDQIFIIKNIICCISPFITVIILYGCIFQVLISKKLQTANIVKISTSIVLTTVFTILPDTILYYGDIRLDYKVNHIVTILIYYMIAVTDPLTILLGFPSIRMYLFTGKVTNELSPVIVRFNSFKKYPPHTAYKPGGMASPIIRKLSLRIAKETTGL